MTEKIYRSECCNAKARTRGVPDFTGSRGVYTISYVCTGCKKPCDLVAPKNQTQQVCAAKKRIQKQGKRLDFEVKILQKWVEIFDGITIHPVKGVILTPKKKRQLAEIKKMEQNFPKSRVKKSRR